ncbi:hypothetical protein [Amycolatopsis sp. MEPSY49]|uniref:tetratricopeptide repeat protein n=1 Tax=Amycolatopsis sp. MEPSY49 TaxID=3151600 RepID=UPI003EF8689A
MTTSPVPGATEVRTCVRCGAHVDRWLNFCTSCGSSLSGQTPVKRLAPPAVRELLARHRDDVRAAWFHLGAVLLEQNRHEEAKSALDKARYESGNTPTDAEVGLLRAWVLDESGQLSAALQAYLDVILLDPQLTGDVLPAAQTLLTVDEAAMLGPWIRATWLPRLRAATGADQRALVLFQTRLAVLTGNGPEAAAALAEALRSGVVAGADELAGLPDAPLPEAQWRFLLGLALKELGEYEAALGFIGEAQARQLPDAGAFGAAEAMAAEADLRDTLTPDSAEAEEMRYEAANMFATVGEHDRAIALFARLAVRSGKNPELHWSWADSIRMASYRSELPPAEVCRQIMDRWWAGSSIALPEESSSWAYLVPALAMETLSWRDPTRPREPLWQACLFAERMVHLGPADMTPHLILARCHRQLENYAVAMVSVLAAMEVAPEGSTDAADEHAVLMSYLYPEQARAELADAAEAAGEEAWPARWELVLSAARSGDAESASAGLAGLTPDAADPWQVWAYGYVLRLLDRDDEAVAWFTQLREASAADRSWTWFRAYAAYALGDLDAAVAEVDGFLSEVAASSHRRHDFLVLGGICRLAQGRRALGDRVLREAAGLIRTQRDALDAVADLRALVVRAGDPELVASAATLTELFQHRAAELAAPVLDVKAARAELARIVGEATGPAAIASLATFARLSCNENVAEAIAGYLTLMEHRELFPEAAVGLCDAGLIDIDDRLRRSDPAAAVDLIGELREPLTTAAETRIAWQANFDAREAFACFWLGQPETGRARFAEAVAGIRAQLESAGAEIGDLWRQLVPDPKAYWRIADHLTGPLDDDLRSAVGRLAHCLDEFLGCIPDGFEVAPCELVIGYALVPAGDAVDDTLFTDLLPAMFEEVQSASGMLLPQVAVLADPGLGPAEYRISLWGNELCAGTAPPGDPQPLALVTRRLGEVLRANLPDLVCLDMTDKLLTRWTADRPDLLGRAIPDDAALVKLNLVLRGLLARGLPLGDGQAVLEEFAGLSSGRGVQVGELIDSCAYRLTPATGAEPRS